MQPLNFVVLLLCVIFANANEKEMQKEQDQIRSGSYTVTPSAPSSPTSCDVVAKLLAAYISKSTPGTYSYSENNSASAPNYTTQIAALYSLLNAIQNTNSASTQSYATQAAAYNSGSSSVSSYAAPQTSSDGSSISQSTYSTPAAPSVYISKSGSIYGNSPSTPVTATASSVGGSGYTNSQYSSSKGAISRPSYSSSSYKGQAGGIRALNSPTGYNMNQLHYYPGSSSGALAPQTLSNSYARYSNLATHNFDGQPISSGSLMPMDMSSARGYYSANEDRANTFMSPFSAAPGLIPNNQRSGSAGVHSSSSPSSYNLVKPDPNYPTDKPKTTPQYNAPSSYSPSPSTPVYSPRTSTSVAAVSTLRNSALAYGGSDASSNYNGGDSVVPVPVCPKNYLFSCHSQVQPMPCSQQSSSSHSAY